MSATAVRPLLDCPRCGARLREDQSWCLECGHGARTRLLPPPSLRVPALVALLATAVLGAGIAFAIVALSGSTDSPRLIPRTSTSPTAGGLNQTQLASWPNGVTGFTPMMLITKSHAKAEARAKALLGKAPDVGVLDSDGYSTLPRHRWLVFSGVYATQAQAEAAAKLIHDAGHGSPAAQQIIPR